MGVICLLPALRAVVNVSVADIAVAWEALFVYDVMIVILTMARTYKERFHLRPSGHRRDLVGLIVRDGAFQSSAKLYVYSRPICRSTGSIYFAYVKLKLTTLVMQRNDCCLYPGSVMASANFANTLTFYVSYLPFFSIMPANTACRF